MEGSLSRRRFLGESAAAAIFLGFPGLARPQSRRAAETEIVEKARARMKRERTYGVAVYVPEDAEERAALGRALEAMVASTDIAVQELLLEAVYFCVPPLLVEGRPVETLVLFDPDFRRVADAQVDCRSDAKAAAARLVEGVRGLLEGEGRLEARASASRTPELEAAIRTIDAGPAAGAEAIREANRTLAENFETCVAAIVAARREAEKARRPTYLHSFLRGRFLLRIGAAGESDLPHGVAWEAIPRPDPCPACGMAFFSPVTRKFLKFLVE